MLWKFNKKLKNIKKKGKLFYFPNFIFINFNKFEKKKLILCINF